MDESTEIVVVVVVVDHDDCQVDVYPIALYLYIVQSTSFCILVVTYTLDSLCLISRFLALNDAIFCFNRK